MLGNSALRIGLALALWSVTAAAATAQVTDSSARETASANATDTTDTYVTVDGYGLGRIVQGSLDDVTQRARTALIKMKVVEEPGAAARGGSQRALRGKGKDNLDVAITLKRQSASTTRVEVTARRGLAEYDQHFAEELLNAVSKT
jgi:hypothetical protein